MSRLRNVNKKKNKRAFHYHANKVTFAICIGAVSFAGYFLGGNTGLCIGSLLGFGMGFLIDSVHLSNSLLKKLLKK